MSNKAMTLAARRLLLVRAMRLLDRIEKVDAEDQIWPAASDRTTIREAREALAWAARQA